MAASMVEVKLVYMLTNKERLLTNKCLTKLTCSLLFALPDKNFAEEYVQTLLKKRREEEMVLPYDGNKQLHTTVHNNEDVSSHNTVVQYNEPGSSKLIQWKDSQVKLLISLYVEHKKYFDSPKFTNKKVWIMIGEKLRNEGIPVTNSQAEIKMKNLKRQFNAVKLYNKTSKNDRKEWKYFSDMEMALGDLPQFEPRATFSSSSGLSVTNNSSRSPAEILSSSEQSPLSSEIPSSLSPENPSSSSLSPEISPSSELINARKRKQPNAGRRNDKDDEPPSWIKTYFETQRAERQNFREKYFHCLRE
ncbi:uncharacterized protein [Centruroides vittatus]|uniref:uncharacterized protein n=1 Tax=Centruroides vittatus TaxID=120091 RepID=UPI003510834A